MTEHATDLLPEDIPYAHCWDLDDTGVAVGRVVLERHVQLKPDAVGMKRVIRICAGSKAGHRKREVIMRCHVRLLVSMRCLRDAPQVHVPTIPDSISLMPEMFLKVTVVVALKAQAFTATQVRAWVSAAKGRARGSTHTPVQPRYRSRV
jgi:hypothetical protein